MSSDVASVWVWPITLQFGHQMHYFLNEFKTATWLVRICKTGKSFVPQYIGIRPILKHIGVTESKNQSNNNLVTWCKKYHLYFKWVLFDKVPPCKEKQIMSLNKCIKHMIYLIMWFYIIHASAGIMVQQRRNKDIENDIYRSCWGDETIQTLFTNQWKCRQIHTVKLYCEFKHKLYPH